MDMSREIEYTLVESAKTLKEMGLSREVLEKLCRQDFTVLREKTENISKRVLEFIANGRGGLVDLREFFAFTVMAIEKASRSLESSLFRLFLASNLQENIGEVKDTYLELLSLTAEMAGRLSSMIRSLSIMVPGEDMVKSIRDKFAKLDQAKKDFEAAYRKGLVKIANYYSDARAFILLKESLDLLEEASGNLHKAGSYIIVIAVNTYVMGV